MNTLDDKAGAEAVQYLQSLAGITITRPDAKTVWTGLTHAEKIETLKAYNRFKPNQNN